MPSIRDDLLSYLRVALGAWRNDSRGDDELLACFAQYSDGEAFKALVWRYGRLVWRACTRVLGEGPDAEDAFQTAFLALARKASCFPIKNLAGWLHQVARRAALNAEAAVRRRQSLEQQLRVITQPEPEDNLGRTELYAALDEELAGLSEKLRVPLVLRYLEGKTQDEVARILGCSRSVALKRLTRGEAILRQRLERRGLEVGIVSVGALLESTVTVSAFPARLIDSTARAAVTFRSGTLTGKAAEAARAVLGSLPSSLETTITRKSLGFVLACVGLLGVGLAAWQVPVTCSEVAESTPSAASPKAVAEPGNGRVDHYGDPLPFDALARLGTLRLRHPGRGFHTQEQGSVIFSRDGKMLLTACPANPIRLWVAATGKLLRSFGDRRSSPWCPSLSSDGRILAARNDGGSVSLWEMATGKLLRQLEAPGDGLAWAGYNVLAFSWDGRTLLTVGPKDYSRDRHERNHIVVWEVTTGKKVRDQTLLNIGKAGPFSTTIFSPDGKTLATIHQDVNRNQVIYLWEAASGKELHHLSLGKAALPRGAVAFSPDSRFLATSSVGIWEDRSDGAVHLWEVATGKEVRKWRPDKAGTCSLAFSPDGKLLATGSAFGPLRLWEIATGKELRRCHGYRALVVALAFSPDGSTLASLAGLHDYTVRLWEVASGKELSPLSRGHVGPVLSVAFSPDGKSLISAGRDGHVGLWNAQTGQEQRPPLWAGDFQALAALSADGKTILSIGNSFSPNGQCLIEVVSQTPTQICVWDRATGQKLRQFPGPVGAPQSLTLSPDGKILVLQFMNRVHVMEVATGKEMRSFDTEYGTILSLDGKTLAMARDGGKVIHFYETATGKDCGDIKVQQSEVSCLAFSPDERTLAVAGRELESVLKIDGWKREEVFTIRLWRRTDKKKWKEAGTLLGHKRIVWGLTFSPDGKTLASASGDGTLRLWEVATGKERRRFAGHGGNVLCAAFSPDGRHLAAGGDDTSILVWDVTGRLQSGRLRPMKLSAQEVKNLWADLAGADAARAGQAVWALAAAPAQVLPFLRKHLLQPDPAGSRIVRLIADLDSETFAIRKKAADELEKLGEGAGPALRQALAKSTSLEMRRRLERLLEPLKKDSYLSYEQVRFCRALEVLGQTGTPEALQLLGELAQGKPGDLLDLLTLEAQATLKWRRTLGNATKP